MITIFRSTSEKIPLTKLCINPLFNGTSVKAENLIPTLLYLWILRINATSHLSFKAGVTMKRTKRVKGN